MITMLVYTNTMTKPMIEQFKTAYLEVSDGYVPYSWPWENGDEIVVHGMDPAEWGKSYWESEIDEVYPWLPEEMKNLTDKFNIKTRRQATEFVNNLENNFKLYCKTEDGLLHVYSFGKKFTDDEICELLKK